MVSTLLPKTHRLALLVIGEERRGIDACPFRRALVGQRLDAVDVVVNREAQRKARREPAPEIFLRAVDQRNNCLAPEGAVGLPVIGVMIVAGDAEAQRRHAEG